MRGDILDLDADDAAAAELAVDRKIEHGEVMDPALDSELRADGPDMLCERRWLSANQLPLAPWGRCAVCSRP